MGILKHSPGTRSRYIPLHVNGPDTGVQVLLKFVNLWTKCVDSDNTRVRLATGLAIDGGSAVADNL